MSPTLGQWEGFLSDLERAVIDGLAHNWLGMIEEAGAAVEVMDPQIVAQIEAAVLQGGPKLAVLGAKAVVAGVRAILAQEPIPPPPGMRWSPDGFPEAIKEVGADGELIGLASPSQQDGSYAAQAPKFKPDP